MAEQLVTLRPNTGAEVAIDGTTYHLGLDTDWGESTVDASLLEGPDITGAVAGQRRLLTRQRSLGVQIRATTGAAYLEAAEALAACVSDIQRYGGTIVRQLDLGGAGLSEALECEVLEAGLTEAEDGWLEATRLHGEMVLNLTTNPGWLADWELAAEGEAEFASASMIEVPVTALRGNLPGPGRIVFTDGASTARRFVELGGAFENYTVGQDTEFRAGASGGEFSLTGADGSAVTTSVTDRIGTHTISVSPVLPAWTTIAFLEDLPQRGTFNVRARVLCEDEDVTVTVRALWRSGSGAWHELESAVIPGDGWWDLPLGTISRYDSAEEMDVRFDVRSTEVTSSTFRLNIATVTATDLYVVARGQTSQGVVIGASGYDAIHTDVTNMNSTRNAQLGGLWTAFGSNDQFVYDGNAYQTRAFEDASISAGRGYILNALSATFAQTVVVDGKIWGTEKGSTTILGAVFRYVNATNFGLACLKVKRTSGGTYKNFLTLYKNIGGTYTILKQIDLPRAVASLWGRVSVSVDTAGRAEATFTEVGKHTGQQVTISATDAVFASAGPGTLDDGKPGFYGVSTSSSNLLTIHEVISYADTTDTVTSDVIRDDGTGELTYADAFSAEADGSDPQPVSSAEGRRIWLPPGLDGMITAKVRTSDSDAEVDTGFSNNTQLDVYYRPAFAALSDTIPEPPVVVTGVADDLTSGAGPSTATATLNGTVNPNGFSTQYYFEYGPSTSYGLEIPLTLDGAAGAGSVAAAVDEAVTGLTAGSLYHFRLVATNIAGTTYGDDVSFTTASAPAYDVEVLADSPLFYWRLDETSGTNANDSSPNNRDGTYSGTYTQNVSGAITGNAAVEVTAGQVASTYDPFVASTTRVFEMCVYRNNSSAYHGIFGDQEVGLIACYLVTGSQDIYLDLGVGATATWTAAFPGNTQWAHVAIRVIEGTTAELFINGVSEGTQAIGTYHASAATIRYGRAGGGNPMDGRLDEVAVYSSLSDARIAAHAAAMA